MCDATRFGEKWGPVGKWREESHSEGEWGQDPSPSRPSQPGKGRWQEEGGGCVFGELTTSTDLCGESGLKASLGRPRGGRGATGQV